MAVAAIDHDPGSALPDPVLCFVAGEGVIEAECAADDEATVGDVMRLPGCPLFDLVVDDEGADMEGLLFGSRPRRVRGDAVGNPLACAEANGVGFGVATGD